jgi:hypothetical protein
LSLEITAEKPVPPTVCSPEAIRSKVTLPAQVLNEVGAYTVILGVLVVNAWAEQGGPLITYDRGALIYRSPRPNSRGMGWEESVSGRTLGGISPAATPRWLLEILFSHQSVCFVDPRCRGPKSASKNSIGNPPKKVDVLTEHVRRWPSSKRCREFPQLQTELREGWWQQKPGARTPVTNPRQLREDWCHTNVSVS